VRLPGRRAEPARRRSDGVWGVLAEYASPTALVRAAEGVREAGYTAWDTHSPFPVHGLERAMGLKRSLVPLAVLTLGLGGAAAGMALQWWVSTLAYPLVVSGKPFFSWPAFVPIMFETGVLGGALGAVFGFLGLSRLPRHHHPLFESKRFERVSDDGFFVSIEAEDPRFERGETVRLLERLGARAVEVIEERPAGAAGRGGAASEARP
jgi:Protein of unknown function (DUF3341)